MQAVRVSGPSLPRTWRVLRMTLLPKVPNAQSLRTFRGISLIDVMTQLEQQSAFAGVSRGLSPVMLAPQLLEHVRSDVDRHASLAKNLRREVLRRKPYLKCRGRRGGGLAALPPLCVGRLVLPSSGTRPAGASPALSRSGGAWGQLRMRVSRRKTPSGAAQSALSPSARGCSGAEFLASTLPRLGPRRRRGRRLRWLHGVAARIRADQRAVVALGPSSGLERPQKPCSRCAWQVGASS